MESETLHLPIAFCVGTVICLSLTLTAFAQSSNATATQQSATSSQAFATSTATGTQAKTATEMRLVLTPLQKTRAKNLTANISNRLDAAIMRLEGISKRLHSRATKLEQEGMDVSLAEAELRTANAALATSKAIMGHIDADIARMVDSEDPWKAWQEIKQTYLETHGEILQARSALENALRELKSAHAKEAEAEPEITEVAPNEQEP